MDDFKNAKNLLEDQREKGMIRKYERPIPEAGEPRPGPRNMRRPTEYLGEVCEQWTSKGCKPSIEAVRLKLRKHPFICTGVVTTTCGVQSRLAAGVTVMELFNK